MGILFKTVYVLVVLAVVALGLLLLASRIPIPGNYQVKIVQSGSMEPSIQTGSIVVIKPQERYEVGDVVTFGEDTPTQVPTTHRIISENIQEGVIVYTTKGDANEEEDQMQTPKSAVIGKVLFDIPYIGYVLDFARTPLGFWTLIGVPAAVVIIDEGMSIVREFRKRKGKDEVTPDTV